MNTQYLQKIIRIPFLFQQKMEYVGIRTYSTAACATRSARRPTRPRSSASSAPTAPTPRRRHSSRRSRTVSPRRSSSWPRTSSARESSPRPMWSRTPRRWRRQNGGQPIASTSRSVLGQPVCASAAERNWSDYGQIKTTTRSRMGHTVSDKRVYCHKALHLKEKLTKAG